MEPTQVTKASLHLSHCAVATHTQQTRIALLIMMDIDSKQLHTHRQAQTQTPNIIVVFLG